MIAWLGRAAIMAPDPDTPSPVRSADPDDDYLLALAFVEGAMLVSGEEHLLSLRSEAPVYGPVELLALLEGR